MQKILVIGRFQQPNKYTLATLIGILETCFADNQKAWRLNADGVYERVSRKGPKIRAQQQFYQEAVDAAREFANAAPQFQPLMRAKK